MAAYTVNRIPSGEAATPPEPSEGSFHNPSSGYDFKTDRCIRSFNDFSFQIRHSFLLRLFKNGALIPAIGKKFLKKRELAKQGSQNQNTAITILNICWMYNSVK